MPSVPRWWLPSNRTPLEGLLCPNRGWCSGKLPAAAVGGRAQGSAGPKWPEDGSWAGQDQGGPRTCLHG